MWKPGDRVLAVSHSEGDTVFVFGEGVYEGEFPPVEAAGILAECVRESGGTNPRIRLDSGEVVYGCECWWGAVEQVRKRFGGARVVKVSIADARAELANNELEEDEQ